LLGRRDFCRQLCLAIGLSTQATAAAVSYAVATHVQDLAKERIHPVFLLDEAHLLHEHMLGQLHILLNYEWDAKALLSLVLVGLPELNDLLQMRRNRSLCSRLHVRMHVHPLTPEDTAECLRYRLKRAGAEREVFTADSAAIVHEAAVGGMRNLDRLASGCLREAARRKKRLVERDLLPRVIDRDRIEQDA
jgi:general secretion pathway protein A